GVGEAQVDELDLLLFNHLHDVGSSHCHLEISSGLRIVGEKMKASDRNKLCRFHAIRRRRRYRGEFAAALGGANQTGAKSPLGAPARCESTPENFAPS